MTTQTDTTNYSKLLDEVTQMRQTDLPGAIAQLRVLGQADFEFRPLAQQYLGITLLDAGRYDEAEQVFAKLVKEHTEPNPFRGTNLYYAAQLAQTLDQYDKASKWIAEAKAIAHANFDMISLGRLRLLEAAVSISAGRSEIALREMISGRQIVDVHSRFRETSISGSTGRTPVGASV